MRKRLLFLGLFGGPVLVLLAVALWLIALPGGEPAVMQRIHTGMTGEEVRTVLGPHTSMIEAKDGRPYGYIWYVDVGNIFVFVGPRRPGHPEALRAFARKVV